MRPFRFSPALPQGSPVAAGDAAILLGLVTLAYAGARLAFRTPAVIAGPEISLTPAALPWYALLSVGRMAAAYVLSLVFSLFYGYAAARNRTARAVLMPLLDVLQSVPILSFLPVVLLGLSAVLPQAVAAEIAAIVLIFTSQAWNMTFSFYQSLTTLPTELREAAAVFRFNPWLRLKTVELPFAAIGLLWNSMMSWSGGWFFLMASEIFHVGARDFRLPGLGAYLQSAANAGDLPAVVLGVFTLIAVILLLDQLVWRPLIAWSERFKMDMVEGDEAPRSWFLSLLSHSRLLEFFGARVWRPFSEWVDRTFQRRGAEFVEPPEPSEAGTSRLAVAILAGFVLLALYGSYRAAGLLFQLQPAQWMELAQGILATFLRVSVALAITLAWTIPVGVFIGTNRRLAGILQPMVQVVASIPATALFPIILLALLKIPGGLNIAAVLLMLMGTQWYLLFNVIAGAAAIPQDLRYTTDLLRLRSIDRWRTLILPALFPYIITGAITASGGAWNASIVAEYAEFGGQTHATIGAGALIARATAASDYPLLLASTLALIFAVITINRTLWRRLYRLAERRYRME
ncbi:MAG TPA: ABC transporter permease subunit [Candidatus Binatia bacterium]|jgi:NitT/TauT family transport system permease protein